MYLNECIILHSSTFVFSTIFRIRWIYHQVIETRIQNKDVYTSLKYRNYWLFLHIFGTKIMLNERNDGLYEKLFILIKYLGDFILFFVTD